jgi:putative nucleotidyltransferase with HDIG domain
VLAGAAAGAASAIVLSATAWPTITAAALLSGAAGALVGGVLAGAVVLAASPLLERVFGHVTSLTLLEALSYDHPLLRRLLTRAPGTFLHSTNVAVLTDVAARAIGADVLTARVGALYHDVGKTAAPEAFMENQSLGGPPPDEGGVSARLLVDHVANGVRLVLQHGLGERVADFVREHHGTTEVRLSGPTPVDGAAVHYPGPRPRSRETAVLMLADQIEATARARRPETRPDCIELAREIVDGAYGRGQLENAGLTDDDLDTLESAFADVLHAMHHRRIGYRLTDVTPPRLRLSKTIQELHERAEREATRSGRG